ncbi:MAG: hypothetical protein IGQ45_12075 [Cyanobacterium sp. T60_A2020_053]|nr:hypothetical protein [Cyanobacterium sp. T60_A2020_053]
MADFTDFFLGIVLWLGSGSFLLTLFNRNDDDSQLNSTSNQTTSFSPLTNQGEDDTLLSNPINDDVKNSLMESLKALSEAKEESEAKLAESLVSLRDADEKIRALELELEQISDQLELSQNQYYQLEKVSQHQEDELNQKISELHQRYQSLQSDYESLPTKLSQQWREKTFIEINSLLTNYPTAKMMIKFKPYLPAKNVISLLKPLENLLSLWDIQSIGKPWQKVNFDPDLHSPDNDNIKSGDMVYIRFVGYLRGENILVKAKVSQSLPGQK